MRQLFALLLFYSISSLSQTGKLSDEQVNASGAQQLTFLTNIKEAKDLAQKDIRKETPFLIFQGGFAPIVYEKDFEFEKKYKAHFLDFGCTSPDHKIIKAYNIEVFKYLTKTFGKNWINECRKDIIGLKEYKRNL